MGKRNPARPMRTTAFSWGVGAFVLLLAACSSGPASAPPPVTGGATAPTASAQTSQRSVTQAAQPRKVTPAATEGPYFKAGSPQRTSLRESGASGSKVVLTGTVVTRSGKPIPQAKVDFWQADANGDYDNTGFGYRGHQFTDDAGRYTLETVVPGEYPGRTSHIHVKVQAPNQARVLTTQLYFPGETSNQRDGIFNPALLVEQQDTSDGKRASFTFVLDME